MSEAPSGNVFPTFKTNGARGAAAEGHGAGKPLPEDGVGRMGDPALPFCGVFFIKGLQG